MVQVRNMPEELHRVLKARAAIAGMSLSDYLLAEMREIAERPTLRELQQRLKTREQAKLSKPAAAVVRSERDAR